MTNADIVLAVRGLRPDAAWVLNGDTYDGLEWRDDAATKPTEQEIVDFLANYTPPPSLQEQLTALQAKFDILMQRTK